MTLHHATVIKTVIAAKAKPVISKHKTTIRIVLFLGIVVLFVICHESTLSAVVVGEKALELFTDVVADRVFPADWLGGGE